MDNSEIILLKEGISPNVDLLSPIEEESILGGATKCDQGYRHCMFRCKSSLAIDSQGNIYKCLEHLGAPNNKVGDLKSGTMSLAKLSHAMFAQNPFHSAECLHCNILPICGGGCPIDREKYIGKDKRFCSIYKENLSELLPYFYTYKYSK